MPVRTRSMRQRSRSRSQTPPRTSTPFPYEKTYNRKKRCWSVRRKKPVKKGTRKVFSKCTTKENANKQMRLLAAILYNPKFQRR